MTLNSTLYLFSATMTALPPYKRIPWQCPPQITILKWPSSPPPPNDSPSITTSASWQFYPKVSILFMATIGASASLGVLFIKNRHAKEMPTLTVGFTETPIVVVSRTNEMEITPIRTKSRDGFGWSTHSPSLQITIAVVLHIVLPLTGMMRTASFVAILRPFSLRNFGLR